MLINHLKIAFRNLWKYKTYSAISVLGFALGLTCFLILLFYVKGEMSYDQFHDKKDRIYRVLRISTAEDQIYKVGVSAGPFKPALENDYPGIVKSVVRVRDTRALITYKDKNFLEEKFFMADPNFFEIFSFPLTQGEASQVLKDANSIVISEEMAEKYFGDEDAIGKTLEIDQERSYLVTGIFNKKHLKSHLDFDFVASLRYLERYEWFDDWFYNAFTVYVLLKDAQQITNLQAMMPAFSDKYLSEELELSGSRIDIKLQAMDEVYFESDTRYDPAKHGNLQTVYILAWVALVILSIAIFNYIKPNDRLFLPSCQRSRYSQNIRELSKRFG